MSRIQALTAVTACTLVVLCSPARAGRPLRVDDANVDAKGTGHVEAWFAREAGSANLFNVAPAYSPWEVVELSALLSRNRSDAITESSVLARLRITEPQESGCNLLGALGYQRSSPGGNQPFAYTAVTCSKNQFTLHANLGAVKPSGTSSFGIWGIALERDHGGLFGHVEAFGREHAKPTFQIGARKELGKGFQVDSTVGRTDGDTVFSLGVKFSF